MEKVNCLSPNEDLNELKNCSSSQWSHLSVIKTGFAIHLIKPQLSKGSGLKIILNKMNLSVDDLLCVGDAPNDLSMFEIANWSVAVGGAFLMLARLLMLGLPTCTAKLSPL